LTWLLGAFFIVKKCKSSHYEATYPCEEKVDEYVSSDL